MYIVLVADTDIDPDGHAEPEAIGPFRTRGGAEAWLYQEQRHLTLVLPVAYREPS